MRPERQPIFAAASRPIRRAGGLAVLAAGALLVVAAPVAATVGTAAPGVSDDRSFVSRHAPAAQGTPLVAPATSEPTSRRITRRAVFGDPVGDSGTAADIRATEINHLDNSVTTATDDQIQFKSTFANPKAAPFAFGDGDLLHIYINSDNRTDTGDPVLGIRSVGADYLIESTADAGSVSHVLLRWTPSGYTTVRPLAFGSEVTVVDQAGGGTSIETYLLPMAELGIGRGQAFTVFSNSAFDFRDPANADADLAADLAPDYSVMTPLAPEAPAIAAPIASAATRSSIVLSGQVDPNRLPTEYVFEYGPTPAFGAQVPNPPGSAGAGDGPTPVSAPITNLAPGTTYHFRLRATNAVGTTFGPVGTFQTEALLPNHVESSAFRPLTCPPIFNGRKCFFRRLRVTVNIRNPNTDTRILNNAAARNTRLEIRCVRGCVLNRSIRLRPGVIRARAVAGGPGAFNNSNAGSRGRLVPVVTTLSSGLFKVDLTNLFTDGRGNGYLLRRGISIEIRATKPGLDGSVNIINRRPTATTITCDEVRGRRVNCRRS